MGYKEGARAMQRGGRGGTERYKNITKRLAGGCKWLESGGRILLQSYPVFCSVIMSAPSCKLGHTSSTSRLSAMLTS